MARKTLETKLAAMRSGACRPASGGDPRPVWESPDDWSAIEPAVGEWIEEISGGLAQMVVAAISVIDFEAIVLDGAFPPSVRERPRPRGPLQGNRLTGPVGWAKARFSAVPTRAVPTQFGRTKPKNPMITMTRALAGP